MQSRVSVTKGPVLTKPAKPAHAPKAPEYFSQPEETHEQFNPSRLSWTFGNIRLSAGGASAACTPFSLAKPLQAKLEVGAVDDPLEREADRIAEQVMQMPSSATPPTMSGSRPTVQRKCSCGGSCDTCKSDQADDEHGKVQRKPAAPPAASVAPSPAGAPMSAPPIVHDALRSPGQPLDRASQAFFEPRFGRSLGNVRVHADALAADSAAAVGALAYTVGTDIIFGRGRFSPGSARGRNLLAHELAHVIQQGHDSTTTLRRAPCLHGSDCKSIPGDPGRFGESVFGKQEKGTIEIGHVEVLDSDPSAPKGAPVKPPPSRQGLPASKLRKLVEDSGFKIPPEALGPFIDEGLTSKVGAEAIEPCADFPGGLPKGAPKDGCCMLVFPEMENRARRLLDSKSPRTPAQDADALELISTVLHEAEHCHFDKDPDKGKKITGGSDCKLDTVVFHGPTTNFDFTVQHYLSELSARIAEFPPYFQKFQASPTKANHDLLHQKEIEITLNKDESISGIIHGLQCACSCESVNKLIEQAVHNVIDSWPKDQASKFLEVMARIMPSWWPKKLGSL